MPTFSPLTEKTRIPKEKLNPSGFKTFKDFADSELTELTQMVNPMQGFVDYDSSKKQVEASEYENEKLENSQDRMQTSLYSQTNFPKKA